MVFTVDDLCLSYLDNFKYFDNIKRDYPKFKLVAFAIGNFKNKESLIKSEKFRCWFEEHKDWVEVGIHSFDHEYPPDGDRDNQEYWISKAIESLKPFVSKDISYRSPGWQTTAFTETLLKNLGIKYLFYESKVKDIQEKRIVEYNIFNSHLYDIESMKKVLEVINT